MVQSMEILSDPSPSALAAAIEANRDASWADLGRSPRVSVHHQPELMWYITGMPSPGGNGLCRTRIESEDVDARIETALIPFKAQKLPMTWHTGPTTQPADLGERLTAHGLRDAGDEPGMAVDLLALNESPAAPHALSIERVSDVEGLRKWLRVFTLAFGLPDAVGEAMFDIEVDLSLSQHHPRRLYIGLMAGEPVATSLLFLGAGVAGIYGVGTLPGARRQGVGTAMTLTPLLEARAMGYRVGVLHASEMGLGVYRRLGFQEYCRLGGYVWMGEADQDAGDVENE